MHDEKLRRPGRELRLSELLKDVSCVVAGPDRDPIVSSVVHDSRRVEPGALFAAIPGFVADGRTFVSDAIARGAAAVLGPPPAPFRCPVPYVETSAPRRALALAAAALCGEPHRRLVLAATTGTSGKTTTSTLIDAVLSVDHPRRGLFGTIVYRGASAPIAAGRTTPEATDLYPMLAALADEGGTAATLEASSHALALDRLAGLRFDVAVFTNLSRDHLDFHRDMDDYFEAKARLFELLKPDARAVVDADDPYGRRLMERLPRDRVVAYTFEDRRGVSAAFKADATARGLVLTGTAPTGAAFRATSPLLGAHNARNLAAAICVAYALRIDLDRAAEELAKVDVVPGRMEPIRASGAPLVLVDYAHKPAALEHVLRASAALKGPKGRLRVVFGCGGDRDRGKRPQMGEIAAREADDVVLTSDNPRSEDPRAIVAEIEAGAARAGGRPEVVLDRAEAIATVLRRASPEDVVVVAGKGHETYQTERGVDRPFDDREVVRAWFAARRDAAGATGAAAEAV
jgi:UDP-N-acetylmuramoyl-L-alanyl-D-glutamate--2,6-diaminopimelate ligase